MNNASTNTTRRGRRNFTYRLAAGVAAAAALITTAALTAPAAHAAPTYSAAVGCPETTLSANLRAGAARVGVYNLCVESSLAAPTGQARTAIKYALRNLGVPYVRSNATAVADRDRVGYFDCSSYVSRAYTAAGVNTKVKGRSPNTTELMRGVKWAKRIPASAARPGDIAVFYTSGGQHTVMLLARGYIAHTNNFGDVAHVTSAKQYPQLGTKYTTYLRVRS